MTNADLKSLSLLMVSNCVRNTVIEDYHAQGKLSDDDMKAFNQEVANKLYTFLTFLMKKSAEDRQVFMGMMALMFPTGWDQPKLDGDFMTAFRQIKRRDGTI
jgi:hypothetical protein